MATAELKVNCYTVFTPTLKVLKVNWLSDRLKKKKKMYNFNQINVLYALFLTSDQHKVTDLLFSTSRLSGSKL